MYSDVGKTTQSDISTAKLTAMFFYLHASSNFLANKYLAPDYRHPLLWQNVNVNLRHPGNQHPFHCSNPSV
jgi:hypothetical protein